MKNAYLLAVLSGLLLGLGWPTYGFPGLLFVGFVPLLMAERQIRKESQKRKGLRVLGVAYLAFLIWNGLTTWWIVYASVFGMFFAVLANSFLMAVLVWLYYLVAAKTPAKVHLLFLPVVWVAFEWFHLNWEFSWPWLNLGNGFSEYPHWIQWYEYTGVLGGSLWVWLVNMGVFRIIEAYKISQNSRKLAIGIAKNVLAVAIPLIGSLLLWATYKEGKEKVTVVVLQPNIDPYSEKYYTSNGEVTDQLFALANGKIDGDTDYIIAPETVFARNVPLSQFTNSHIKKRVEEYLKPFPKANFLSGISFIEWLTARDAIGAQSNRYNDTLWYNDYNAAFLLNRTEAVQLYYKSKLVVGVEFFPFKSILEPLLGNILLDLGGTVATKITQKERTVFSSADGVYKAAPIICYESVYGDFVTGYVRKGANFLAIITNDGWWSNTQGHKQHLSYARLRAIETRRSIARSANTGISAIINQRGEVLTSLAYNSRGVLGGSLSINKELTFYVRYGDYIGRIAGFLAVVIFIAAMAKKRP